MPQQESGKVEIDLILSELPEADRLHLLYAVHDLGQSGNHLLA